VLLKYFWTSIVTNHSSCSHRRNLVKIHFWLMEFVIPLTTIIKAFPCFQLVMETPTGTSLGELKTTVTFLVLSSNFLLHLSKNQTLNFKIQPTTTFFVCYWPFYCIATRNNRPGKTWIKIHCSNCMNLNFNIPKA